MSRLRYWYVERAGRKSTGKDRGRIAGSDPLYRPGGAIGAEQLHEDQKTAHQQRWHVDRYDHPIHPKRVREYVETHRLDDRVHRVEQPDDDHYPDQCDGT